jgi:hypothetical protein
MARMLQKTGVAMTSMINIKGRCTQCGRVVLRDVNGYWRNDQGYVCPQAPPGEMNHRVPDDGLR